MLPASNRGAGMNIGFPDVCLTPAAPAPIPVPYPNIAMNAMATPFSPIVKLTNVPALNQGSVIPMSTGDEGGTAHPVFKTMGQYTMGNPIVHIDQLPAINLACPTTGNDMNNPLGAVLVPSVTNVFFTLDRPFGKAPEDLASGVPVSTHELEALASAIEPTALATVTSRWVEAGVALVRVPLFVSSTSTLVWNAISELGWDDVRALIVDVRNNRGGDADAAFALADDFLPEGALLGTRISPDGDRSAVLARQSDPYVWPVAVLIDCQTASAAEIFAGALASHDRAILVGQRTYGKGSGQRLLPTAHGLAYATTAHYELPNGRRIDGVGIEPDVAVEDEDDSAVSVAIEQLRDRYGAIK